MSTTLPRYVYKPARFISINNYVELFTSDLMFMLSSMTHAISCISSYPSLLSFMESVDTDGFSYVCKNHIKM